MSALSWFVSEASATNELVPLTTSAPEPAMLVISPLAYSSSELPASVIAGREHARRRSRRDVEGRLSAAAAAQTKRSAVVERRRGNHRRRRRVVVQDAQRAAVVQRPGYGHRAAAGIAVVAVPDIHRTGVAEIAADAQRAAEGIVEPIDVESAGHGQAGSERDRGAILDREDAGNAGQAGERAVVGRVGGIRHERVGAVEHQRARAGDAGDLAARVFEQRIAGERDAGREHARRRSRRDVEGRLPAAAAAQTERSGCR